MSVPTPDYYAVLGVARSASPRELRQAFRALVRRVHPDHPGNDRDTPGAPDISLVNAAWAVLGNPERRAAYDRATAGGRPADQPASRRDLPPAPKGFRLYPRPAFGFWREDPRYRVADARRGALSLVAESRDLSPLGTLGDDDVWLLDLKDLPIRDTDLSALARFRTLVVLVLSGCPVTDAGISKVAALRALETLHLDDTALTDHGLAPLAGHPSLSLLDIRRTSVRGDGIRHLVHVPNLRELRATGSAFRAAAELFRERPAVKVH